MGYDPPDELEESFYYNSMPTGQLTFDHWLNHEVHEPLYLECMRCGSVELWPDRFGYEEVPDYETALLVHSGKGWALCDYCSHMSR